MTPAPFLIVTEHQHQQHSHQRGQAYQKPQAGCIRARMRQLKAFAVQDGKGHGTGVTGLCNIRFILNPVNKTFTLCGKFDSNRFGQQVVPFRCLDLGQLVASGFQILERVIFTLAIIPGRAGNGAYLSVAEIVGIINLRLSTAGRYRQSFQLELHAAQRGLHFRPVFACCNALLDDIQRKLRVLQLIGQFNLTAAAGYGSIGCTAGRAS